MCVLVCVHYLGCLHKTHECVCMCVHTGGLPAQDWAGRPHRHSRGRLVLQRGVQGVQERHFSDGACVFLCVQPKCAHAQWCYVCVCVCVSVCVCISVYLW